MAINFSFFFVVTFVLIICQTIIFPGTALFSQGFDSLFIVILYLSLVFSHYGAVIAIVVVGGIMDSISGSPFFLHIFSYLWVYILVRMFRQFVFHGNAFFILAVSITGVAFQQVLILFAVFVSQGTAGVSQIDFSLPVRQVAWAAVCIPPGVWVLSLLRQNWVGAARQFGRTISRKIRD